MNLSQILFITILTVVTCNVLNAQLPKFTEPVNFKQISYTQLSGNRCSVIIPTTDDGILRAGLIDSNNAIISKVAKTGIVEWETVLNKDSSMEVLNLFELNDGNFLATGYLFASGNSIFQNEGIIHAVLLNKNGTIIWKMPVDTSVSRYLYVYNPIIVLPDNHYTVLTIDIANYTTKQLVPALQFYGSNGSVVKKILYDSLHSETMSVYPFLKAKENGFIALLHCELGAKTFKQLLRLDSNGLVLWKKEWYDTEYSQFGGWSSVIESNDGTLFIATTEPRNGDTSYIIMRKFDGNGELLLKKQYGSKLFNAVAQMKETLNGDIVIVGYGFNGPQGVGADISLYRTSRSGNLIWKESFGDSTKGDYGMSISIIDNNTFIIGIETGKTIELTSQPKPYLIKISDLPSSVEEQTESAALTLSPNPTNTSFTIGGIDNIVSVKLMNSLGVEVVSRTSLVHCHLSFDRKRYIVIFLEEPWQNLIFD
ncbi:MAG: hypothetical protein U0264_10915 [Candidatus Kapaibacterium sp.]